MQIVFMIPCFYGHTEYINIEKEISVPTMPVKFWKRLLDGVLLIILKDEEGDYYVTPVECSSGEDKVYISRIRKDQSVNKTA